MNKDLRPGQPVLLPTHRLSGTISAIWGASPERRVMVDLPDGSTTTVTEGEVEPQQQAEPAARSPAKPATTGQRIDLVTFARSILRRTSGVRTEEAAYLAALAQGYLDLREAAR